MNVNVQRARSIILNTPSTLTVFKPSVTVFDVEYSYKSSALLTIKCISNNVTISVIRDITPNVMNNFLFLVNHSFIYIAPTTDLASVCVLVNVTTRIAIETIISINPYKPVPSVVIKLLAFSSNPAYTTRQTNMKYP